MSAYLSTASLLLFPQSPEWLPEDNAVLINQLRTLGFTGEAINSTAYFAGEHFLDHISFMGCAPSIRFSPEAGNEKFTHIRIHSYDSITALIGQHARAPNCPQCKKAYTHWDTQLDSLAEDTQWACEHCQHSAAPWNYQWRKSAGFARMFIEVTDIYPKEALPQQELLEALQSFFATPWQFSYLF